MNDKYLAQYGAMAVRAGVNIQKGQTLIINAPITARDLVHHCATAAYDAGAREVVVNWSDEQLSRIKMDRTRQEVLCDVKPWIQESYLQYIKSEGSAAILSITGSDPEIYKGLDMAKVNAANIARMMMIFLFIVITPLFLLYHKNCLLTNSVSYVIVNLSNSEGESVWKPF